MKRREIHLVCYWSDDEPQELEIDCAYYSEQKAKEHIKDSTYMFVWSVEVKDSWLDVED